MARERYNARELLLGEDPGKNPRRLRREDFEQGSGSYLQRNMQASVGDDDSLRLFPDWKALPGIAVTIGVQMLYTLFHISNFNLGGIDQMDRWEYKLQKRRDEVIRKESPNPYRLPSETV